ncbi:MAG: hypothetical protein FWC76_01905 [Defluviitaleaceae bacterium]|nr:hypothetical protein [Defluviitaleaceae bacterium]
MKQILYRPVKKNSNMDFVVKKLEDAEKTLNLTVGGVAKKKKRKGSDKEKKEE